jgi:plasmid stabilization system protein ParE
MSYRVTIRPSAESDILNASLWYESQRPGLAEEFLDDLISTMMYLEYAPLSFTAFGSRFRQIPMARFPYVLVYELFSADEVVILAVFHTSRDPKQKPSAP